MSKITGLVEKVERLNNTYSGNPRYRVTIGGVRYETVRDVPLAHLIEPASLEKRTITAHVKGDHLVGIDGLYNA